MAWHKATEFAELPPDTGHVVQVEGREVALFKVGAEVCAMDNECPHREGPLGEGELEGEIVTCPFHAWQINVRSGAVVDFPDMCSRTYPTRVEGSAVYVEID